MASISSLGIGSGLDLNGLLDKLTKAEQQRLTPYTTQQTSYNAQLTAYGTLKSSLEKFDNLSKDRQARVLQQHYRHQARSVYRDHHRQIGAGQLLDRGVEARAAANADHSDADCRPAGQTGHAGQQRSFHLYYGRQPAERDQDPARRRSDLTGRDARRHQ